MSGYHRVNGPLLRSKKIHLGDLRVEISARSDVSLGCAHCLSGVSCSPRYSEQPVAAEAEGSPLVEAVTKSWKALLQTAGLRPHKPQTSTSNHIGKRLASCEYSIVNQHHSSRER